MVKSYKHLAGYYDRLMSEQWYQLWFGFVKRCVARVGLHPRLIIDAACGTGRLAVLLQELAPVIGFDRSQEMIKIARRRHKKIKFLVADLQYFALPRNQRADVVVCVFDSLNYLSSFVALRYALRQLSYNLAPGGLLIFDVNGEKAFARKGRPECSERYFSFGTDRITWRNFFYHKKWRAEFEIHSKDKFGRKRILRETHVEYYYAPMQIIKVLKSAGLHTMGVYRDRAMHRPMAVNKRYFFVARKMA